MKLFDVKSKVEYLIENFKKIEKLKDYSFEEFIQDFEHVDATLYILQSSIEALLDIARYITAHLATRIPSSNAELIEILKEEGFLDENETKMYIQMVNFRNRVVHKYNTIDYELLYEILQKDSAELKIFLDKLLDIIKTHKNPQKGKRYYV